MTALGITQQQASELVGKTIVEATPEQEHDRTNTLTLTFGDGSKVEISYWAPWAEDGTLELQEVIAG